MDYLEDDELLDSISRHGRMMRALAKLQGQEMNAARERGISEDLILDAQRVSPTMTDNRRRKNRNRH